MAAENGKKQRKCCPVTTLSATNPTSTGLKSYLVLRGEKPVTDFPNLGIFLVLQSCYILYVGKDADIKMDLAPCSSGSSVYLVYGSPFHPQPRGRDTRSR